MGVSYVSRMGVSNGLKTDVPCFKTGVSHGLCPGAERERTLYPRLIAMNLDQPEAQAFYGMKNKTSCSKCTRRKGRSAHRRASQQRGSLVNRLYNVVENSALTERVRTLASEKLTRWGFNPKRRCLLTSVCKSLLVRAPGTDEVFPGLDFRDKLHGLFAFLFRAFDKIFKKLSLSSKNKTILEQRLLWVCQHGGLRDPCTKRSYRVQHSLFNAANLGTVDKVCLLFLLPHVIGHEGSGIPQDVRMDFLIAISIAQELIIAVRGNRSYSERELDILFNKEFVTLFRLLERINACNTDKIFNKKMQKHRRKPDKYPAPKRFIRNDRLSSHFQNNSNTRSKHPSTNRLKHML